MKRATSVATGMGLLLLWEVVARVQSSGLLPGPAEVGEAFIELSSKDVLLLHVVASLYRVSVGFSLAVLVGVPLGLWMGWSGLAHAMWNPVVQLLRPISPIAWIPLAILWFGVSDAAPIFLIFLSSVFPLAVHTAAAVRGIPPVFLLAARNLGLSQGAMIGRVVFPAVLPSVVTGLRVALGVAWMVVVAAEMIAVRSGLGWLIIDARNAGKRYDLVVAGMILIGLIGLLLDTVLRRLERLDGVRWQVRE